jgi:two-component system, sensor histidine kinase and response regulator
LFREDLPKIIDDKIQVKTGKTIVNCPLGSFKFFRTESQNRNLGYDVSPMKNLRGLRALVVEDDRFIQSVIKANLESIGIPSVIAGNGIEAIEAIKTDSFDFVLMDIRMPEEDGIDAA